MYMVLHLKLLEQYMATHHIFYYLIFVHLTLQIIQNLICKNLYQYLIYFHYGNLYE
ncbi:hypothetical protein GLOIN_2v1504979, partial [Rhizophagus irregularis DAOM 181602=DAOM 197198]